MKKLYSDLLDCYNEEKIHLKKAPAVSSDRIYALANAKAGKENVFMEKKHNRLPVVLAVVVAAVLLMGAGVLASNSKVTSFFQSRWEDMTGEEISDGHLATIESFSTEIGLSQVSEGVTVTLDSAIVGENELYIFIKVNGKSITDSDNNLWFDECSFRIDGMTSDYTSGIGQSNQLQDGSHYFFLECTYELSDPDATTIDCTLHLGKLHTDYHSEYELEVMESKGIVSEDGIIDGEWDFEFTLGRNALSSISLLEDGERKTVTVEMYDTETTLATHSLVLKDVTVDVTSAVVTEFGITVTYDDASASVPYGTYSNYDNVYAVMQDGSEVSANYWIDDLNDDGTTLTIEYFWYSLIDMNELKAIRIGDTEFYVNTEESEAIESSVQEIGISETQDQDITVTIDSAMAGKNEMYFLLRIEGESVKDVLDPSEHWYFDSCYFNIENVNVGAYGTKLDWKYVEDGVYYWLWTSEYETLPDDVTSLNCLLSMGAFHSNAFYDGDVVIDGSWSFEFAVDVGDVSSVYLTTDIEGVSAMVMSEFGINYIIDTSVNENRWKINVVAVMKDGSEVITGSGFEGTESDEGYFIASSGAVKHWYRQWEVPIDLDEVDYLYFVDGAGDFIDGTIIQVS